MTELKDKTVEELRKMASRKKIEGRSKMNKAELIRALKKKSTCSNRLYFQPRISTPKPLYSLMLIILILHYTMFKSLIHLWLKRQWLS